MKVHSTSFQPPIPAQATTASADAAFAPSATAPATPEPAQQPAQADRPRLDMATLVRLLLMQMQLKLSQPGDAAEDPLKLATGQDALASSSGSLIDDISQTAAADAQAAAVQTGDEAMPQTAASSAALQAYAGTEAAPGKPLASA
ncbi:MULTISPECIES: hypothetical protein [Chromobacterium]|uniref:Uncharacterized protein n=1 Tax=Chromobacterium rhizoryzae TaxID=1778675 RepID=A0AAD0RRT4_9NEIS|nr:MULTISPECIES: hypothetical protein [Chromobacterium]AXT46230.1 hypothetical protein D1345_08575 [Chromobacterium rhizoryzae]QOD84559.1 hypothetical protein IEZ30_08860 [Chromobacterium haemolyticum]